MGLTLIFMVYPAAAHAQQAEKVARVGILSLNHAPTPPQLTFAKAMQALGYVEGKNVVYESLYAKWQIERLPELAAELVRQKVDVIVAITNIPAFAAKKTTSTVPIVVWGIHGAVKTGLVHSLAQPGGNVTGIESLAPELDAKRLELIKEIVPKLVRLGVVYNPNDQATSAHLMSTQEAAHKLGVQIVQLPVKRADEFASVLLDATAESIDALLTLTDTLTASNRKTILQYALKHRLPTVCEFRIFASSGCLLTYGSLFEEFSSVVARQVDRILKGAKPGDLPVEQVSKFEMVLNMKTAKTLDISIPPLLRMKADDLVE